MKAIKWKSTVISCIVCLLPILLGLFLWDKLPDKMAIHFDLYNNPDNFASKGFAVFGIPLIMTAFQLLCCITVDLGYRGQNKVNLGVKMSKWIIPILTFFVQVIISGYALGMNIDIRKAATLLIGAIIILTGCFMPESDCDADDPKKAEKNRKICSVSTVIMGILMLITVFMPPIATVVWLFLMIPYSIFMAVISKKKSK